MTADLVKGKGFKGALRYNLQKVEKQQATVLDSTFVSLKEQQIMQEVAMVKALRPNLQKYFYHTSLNFPPEENLADEKLKAIAMEYLEAMGFDQHQYLLFRHFDAGHPHVHLLVNRIGYDGSVVSDSRDYQRTEQVLRKLEKKHGLIQVQSSKQAQERAMTKDELEMMKRKNEPSAKLKLQVIIKDVLNKKPTTEHFIQLLESKGIDVLFNQASTGFVSGISYGYEGLQFKGAHLGQAYKWQAVRQAISYEPERDRQTIRQSNDRVRAPAERRAEEQSAGTTTGAPGTASALSGGRDQKAVPTAADDAVQGAGNLRERIALARTGTEPGHGRAGDENGKAKQGTGGAGTAGEGDQRAEQGRQQVAHPALPHFDPGRVLLGADHDAGAVDQGALKAFEKKPKKKKRLRPSPS
ncbi:relaxase/mobilization nuclease domain-containing protein [Mucilaginibacter sp. PAMB04168]|uniref:relaxase/mobilization nuclease domain-containing protein n=1 Tax=Mucilaginibacter sp. PAMB04168 TaxID=3138567 RepID=UPI0031F64399